MGKSLLPVHLRFFTERMDEHDLVIRWELIDDEQEYLFRIRRSLSGTQDEIIVHLTDAYRYGLAEFYARPNQLRAGSYVVIAILHASAAYEVTEKANEARIGIGYTKDFMGALNYRNVWEYVSPEERRRRAEEQRQSESEAQGRDKSR